jgi:hypothetical protein
VQLSPEFIAALRHRYVETDQPVREIIAEFGISLGRLNRQIEKDGWPKRKDCPPRQLPAALRLLEEARLLAAQSASAAPLSIRHPEERAQRASKGDGPDGSEILGPHPSRLGAERLAPQDDGDGLNAAARIEQLVLKEIGAEEAVRAQIGNAPRAAADAERSARTLSILTQTLQNVQRLCAAQCSVANNNPGRSDFDDDMPADLDEFRRDLARRIDAFVASRIDDGDAGRDRTAGPVAAAR